MQFSNAFLFPPALSWNQLTIPIGLQISILCATELHGFSAQCVFNMKQSIFLLCETSKFCLHAGGVILHCVPGWMPEKACIPSWELDCKEANPFMYVCSCFLISDIGSIVKNLGIALCLDFPCISMCQMSSESFFPAVYFSHVLIDHYNNVLIMWGSGVWALWLQKPIMAFFSMDLKEPFIASLHPQLASFPYNHTTKSKVSKNIWERFNKRVLWQYIPGYKYVTLNIFCCEFAAGLEPNCFCWGLDINANIFLNILQEFIFQMHCPNKPQEILMCNLVNFSIYLAC